MPGIETTERFELAFSRLPAGIRKKVAKALRLLGENPRHPSLQTKPVQHARGIFECRVDQSYRITYQRRKGDILLLRTVGRHDETLKKP